MIEGSWSAGRGSGRGRGREGEREPESTYAAARNDSVVLPRRCVTCVVSTGEKVSGSDFLSLPLSMEWAGPTFVGGEGASFQSIRLLV